MLVPLTDELFEFGAQVRLRGEVGNAESFSLQNTEPLFHLVHPRTVDGREMEMKTRMLFEPGLDLLARVHRQIVTDDMNKLDGRPHLFFHVREEGDELGLALAFGALPVDDTRTGVECGKQLQCARAGVFMLHKCGVISGLRGLRGMDSGSRLERGFLVNAQHDFIGGQWTRIPINHITHPPVKLAIPRMFGRQPHVMAPRFQLAGVQNAANGLSRDRVHQSICNHLVGQFRTIPLRQRAPHQIRPLACQFCYMGRHDGLKKKGFGHGRVYLPNRPSVPVEIDRPICIRSDE